MKALFRAWPWIERRPGPLKGMNMFETERKVARQAAREGGAVLKDLFGHLTSATYKGERDLVTEADLASERVITDRIGRIFPQDSILSEEAGMWNREGRRTWLIDPLDGTVNYAHGFPFFAVSIALEEESEVVLGVVLDPFTGECFETWKGGGAWVNQVPISVSRVPVLEKALVATGFPYDLRQRASRVLGLFEKMVLLAQGVRRPGAAALDLCYVASGRMDGFWEEGLHPWDTAAGILLVNEAGGITTTYEGQPYTPYQDTLVAANPLIHARMVSVLKERSPG